MQTKIKDFEKCQKIRQSHSKIFFDSVCMSYQNIESLKINRITAAIAPKPANSLPISSPKTILAIATAPPI